MLTLLYTKTIEKHCWEFELTQKLNKTFRSRARQDLKKKILLSSNFSLQGCLPLSEIPSCYSWRLYWLLQLPLLSPHCAVWKSGHLKCSLVPLLLWSLFLKQHRIGWLLMVWGDIARLYRRNHLSACAFMCVRAYCLQPTKAVHGSIQGMKKRVVFWEDGSFLLLLNTCLNSSKDQHTL